MSLGSTVRQQAPRVEVARRRGSRRARHNRIVGYLFISPWLIGFLVFALYPFLIYPITTYDAPLLPVVPGVLLTIAILCMNFIGDGLRDALDPRYVR